MASPLLTLGETHRNAQDQLARVLQRLILAQWRSQIEPGVPSDAATAAWLSTVAPLALAYRDRSATLARGFYAAARSLGVPGAPALGQVSADDVDIEAIITSLKVVGVIGMTQKIVAGMPPDLAHRQAGKSAAGAGVRHALNGGRSLTSNAIQQDPVALGYYRQTRPDCCAFCALLASRGAVYKEDSFTFSDAQFFGDLFSDVKVHDNCHCAIVPVYEEDQELPQTNLDAFDVYVDARDAYLRGEYPTTAKNPVLASFRSAWDARVRAAS